MAPPPGARRPSSYTPYSTMGTRHTEADAPRRTGSFPTSRRGLLWRDSLRAWLRSGSVLVGLLLGQVAVGCGKSDEAVEPADPLLEAPFLRGFNAWPDKSDARLAELRSGMPSRVQLAEIVRQGSTSYAQDVVGRVARALEAVLPPTASSKDAITAIGDIVARKSNEMWTVYSRYHSAVESALLEPKANVAPKLESAIMEYIRESGPISSKYSRGWRHVKELRAIELPLMNKFVSPILLQYCH